MGYWRLWEVTGILGASSFELVSGLGFRGLGFRV